MSNEQGARNFRPFKKQYILFGMGTVPGTDRESGVYFSAWMRYEKTVSSRKEVH